MQTEFWWGNLLDNSHLGTLRVKREDNIKIQLVEIRYENVWWMEPVHQRA
jgi:hypothetical protein